RGDTGAVHQAKERTQFRGLRHGGLTVRFRGHVAVDERLAKLFGQLFTRCVVYIGDHDLGAVVDQHAYGTCARSRGAAGHDENLTLYIHLSLFLVELAYFTASNRRALISSTLPTPAMRRYFGALWGSFAD